MRIKLIVSLIINLLILLLVIIIFASMPRCDSVGADEYAGGEVEGCDDTEIKALEAEIQ